MGKLISKNNKDEIVNYYDIFKDDIYFCSGKNLTEIISIPNDIERLRCRNNKLTSLPELPKNLTHLACEDNNIKQLPNLRELKRLHIVSCDMCCFEPYVLEMKKIEFEF